MSRRLLKPLGERAGVSLSLDPVMLDQPMQCGAASAGGSTTALSTPPAAVRGTCWWAAG